MNARTNYASQRRAFRVSLKHRIAGAAAFKRLERTDLMLHVANSFGGPRLFGVQAARNAQSRGFSFGKAVHLNLLIVRAMRDRRLRSRPMPLFKAA